DYWAVRASIVANLTPDIENYTVATYAHTRSNGIIPKLTKCFGPAAAAAAGLGATLPNGAGQALGAGNFIPLGQQCDAQVAREAPFGPWTVSNRLPISLSQTESWQVINTTTAKVSDSLTVKGILAYGQFRGVTNIDVYGNYGVRPGITPGTETSGNQVTGFAFIASDPISGHGNAQSSFVGELQLQGTPGDGRFIWQLGAYTEINDPLGFSGTQTATFTACNDPQALDCLGPTANFSAGSASYSISKTQFRNYAVYGQASYNLTDALKLTAGLRYTWDRQNAEIHLATISLATNRFTCTNLRARDPAVANYALDQRTTACGQNLQQGTQAPTWLINLDYKPIENVMFYAKYARGYRQGGLALFGPDSIQSYDKEKVDNYEVGVKSSWRGSVPGTFNVAGFYNDFRNQQLSIGFSCQPGGSPNPTCTPLPTNTASVANAGKSRLYGFEAELALRPFDGFRLEIAYAYLNSKIVALAPPTLPATSLFNTITLPVAGGVIPNSQPHKLTVGANYTLPLPDSIGRITFGGLYVYTGKYQVTADSCPILAPPACPIAAPGEALLPGTHVVNLNISWEGIAGLPIDASAFVTNVTNEVVVLNRNDSLVQRGFVASLLGEPRMFGVRLKYRFGAD
ncbi:MAG: TonB-dependent receptor, partial [Novosphingobium sp.]